VITEDSAHTSIFSLACVFPEANHEHRFMKTEGPLTMQSVARAAGVARSTVSKALRDDPTIPEKRRAEIKAIAARLGYRPHPMVAALMAQLHTHRRRRNDPQHLAWIDLWTKTEAELRRRDRGPAYRGACRRAQELGYNIEVYHVFVEGLSPARLRQVLIARSQWGLLFPPAAESAMRFAFDMEGLTGVAIGTSLREPLVHRVAHNHYQGCALACRKLREKGFKRIGFVISPWHDARTDRRWRAGYLVEQQEWPLAERLPPLLAAADGAQDFQRWFRRYKPDTIIAVEEYVKPWLRSLNASELRIAWLALEDASKGNWGIDYRSEQLGAAAVELVLGQIHRHERGSPIVPHSLLIDGVWIES
jgi:LacI family transcriptional regulator